MAKSHLQYRCVTTYYDFISKHGLNRSKYDQTMYYSKDDKGWINFVLVVQVGDYLYAGTPKRIESFEVFLKRTFKVSKLTRSNLSLMVFDITQNAYYSIQLSQVQKLDDVDPRIIFASIGKGGEEISTLDQPTKYRHLIGNMLFIGRMSSALMLFSA